jgi:RHS repeat-associated protein
VANTVYYVHGDHLGRPERVTDTGLNTVWRANNAAFDRVVTIDQIGGLHVGFPGQWYDAETGHWYNIHRNYDARTGRYLESDPIGLAGGPNTYSYGLENAVMRTDRFGLCPAGLTFGSQGLTWSGGEGVDESAWATSLEARRLGEEMVEGAQAQIEGAMCRNDSTNPAAILAGASSTGGLAGLVGGAHIGLVIASAEMGHMGVLGGLVATEGAFAGGMAGLTLGLSGGALIGVGLYGTYLSLPICSQ